MKSIKDAFTGKTTSFYQSTETINPLNIFFY